jgi:predicted RND superfamily exporter protein
MYAKIMKLYEKIVLKRPLLTSIVLLLIILGVGSAARNFRLDASADSLLLENDQDLKYSRSINAAYGSSDYVVLSYTPDGDLLAPESLTDLKQISAELKELERVDTITSILSVPLIDSPRVSLSELGQGIKTLENSTPDIELVRKEFQNNPLYKGMLVSPDGKTTALLVNFKRDATYHELLDKRNSLREKSYNTQLSAEEDLELERANTEFDTYSRTFSEREAQDVEKIRKIMDRHREHSTLFLGGIPMIVADMIDFIKHDLTSFGLGVLVFLVGMLILIFRRFQWIVLPMVCCFMSVLFMFGVLGILGWRVTVVSSNFTSLLLIITLSLCVHLIVRYNELYEEMPGSDHLTRVKEMVRSKAVPSIFTALTTIVAFISLVTSDIRPVIDFGWMMAIGIGFALIISFVLFPAGLMLMKEPTRFTQRFDVTGAITNIFTNWVEKRKAAILAIFILISAVSIYGISILTVENRFIDYFKPTTEIYQGMELIDRQLGGTTPLDIILDADPEFLAAQEQKTQATEDPLTDDFFDDDFFADNFFDDVETDAGLSGNSYWYSSFQVDRLQRIQDYLEQQVETGKVQSMATTFSLMRMVNEDRALDDISLALIHKKLPEVIKESLFNPYMSEDGNQVRFSLRIIDSEPSLHRAEFLKKLKNDLSSKFDLKPEQIHLTGMFVLYNNVLQSLFHSQIMTIGVVFFVIMLMFLLQFRSLQLAIIAIVPNLISAATVLGLMGLLGIPLDIMTITIAAITIGIAVDDTIHYIHRFREEQRSDSNLLASMQQAHHTVGRAMFYTSVTIIIGFSILGLSSFNPTIYFGLFTGLAMLVAMFANLTLLPVLLMLWPGKTQ